MIPTDELDRSPAPVRTWRALLAVLIAGCAGTSVLVQAAPVAAASRTITVTTSAPVNVRALPTPTARLMGQLPKGVTVKVDAQALGASVQGSRIWDRVVGYGWVSDSYVHGTPVGRFDGRVPRDDRKLALDVVAANLDSACADQNRGPNGVANPGVRAYNARGGAVFGWVCARTSVTGSGQLAIPFQVSLGASVAVEAPVSGIDVQRQCSRQRPDSRATTTGRTWICVH